MKTRLDIILETVQTIMETTDEPKPDKPKKKKPSDIARIARILNRDPERGRAIMARLGADDRANIELYIRGEGNDPT